MFDVSGPVEVAIRTFVFWLKLSLSSIFNVVVAFVASYIDVLRINKTFVGFEQFGSFEWLRSQEATAFFP